TLEQVMRRAVSDAELSVKATPHSLRHSFATHLMEQGVGRQHIQALLGHRDPKSTEIYLHVSNKSLMGIRSPFDRKEGAGHE
ncbi:MAG TPA: tyrosine-type recombinase/integrase, partial [Candidatus Mediterraneibacter stercoripullorum]|nr:tyrosine-type recombinase/integrase [Candidatus Mediterraneibacter stercoripullorum]